jgi:hypothetical protein
MGRTSGVSGASARGSSVFMLIGSAVGLGLCLLLMVRAGLGRARARLMGSARLTRALTRLRTHLNLKMQTQLQTETGTGGIQARPLGRPLKNSKLKDLRGQRRTVRTRPVQLEEDGGYRVTMR